MSDCESAFALNFVEGGAEALWRLHAHYAAVSGVGNWPHTTCNAPWVSAVLEPDGTVRPCFFQPAYDGLADRDLRQALNSPQGIAFRRRLDVHADDTCRRCVCRLSLPLLRRA